MSENPTNPEDDMNVDDIKQSMEDKLAQARKVVSDFYSKYLRR